MSQSCWPVTGRVSQFRRDSSLNRVPEFARRSNFGKQAQTSGPLPLASFCLVLVSANIRTSIEEFSWFEADDKVSFTRVFNKFPL